MLSGYMETYTCDACHRSYRYKKGLNQHVKYECGVQPQFQCPVDGCFYRAKVKGNLTKHLIRHNIDRNENNDF